MIGNKLPDFCLVRGQFQVDTSLTLFGGDAAGLAPLLVQQKYTHEILTEYFRATSSLDIPLSQSFTDLTIDIDQKLGNLGNLASYFCLAIVSVKTTNVKMDKIDMAFRINRHVSNTRSRKSTE